MLDSGIRRGSDVLVALCLGAKFVFLGRPGLYAVSACGLEGARHLIEILRAEIDLTMGQMGCPTIADLSADRVRRRDVAVATPIGAEASNAAHA
jgi:L-lactate dehydrogenase (cytochrome)/(S)-mandelate dehydrogenase